MASKLQDHRVGQAFTYFGEKYLVIEHEGIWTKCARLPLRPYVNGLIPITWFLGSIVVN